MNFYTSDLHFGALEYLEGEDRPFSSNEEMNETIISNINKMATADDDLYVIGDFTSYCFGYDFPWKDGLKNVQRINPRVHLLLGNHEQRIQMAEFGNKSLLFIDYLRELGFYEVSRYPAMRIEDHGHELFMRHFPAIACHLSDNDIHLYGHWHRQTGDMLVNGVICL